MNHNNIEIERKFLVEGEFKKSATRQYLIKQGYLCATPERTVRVRIKGDKGYITIKGASNENGFSRFEWEKEISVQDAEQLLQLADKGIIDKIRYEVIYDGKIFEVDEFHGENEGLLLAELELTAENEPYSKPEWLGEEVTQDHRYYNSYLSRVPYKTWKNKCQ